MIEAGLAEAVAESPTSTVTLATAVFPTKSVTRTVYWVRTTGDATGLPTSGADRVSAGVHAKE
jgi:hypothetical protein